MSYEVIRVSRIPPHSLQRCGHIHRSKNAAIKCANKLNKDAILKWHVSQ